MKDRFILVLVSFIVLLIVVLFGDHKLFPVLGSFVFAHCDTMGGPVIKDAQRALESGNADVILKWVQKKDEAEIKTAFEKTLAVRKLNPEAKELADMYFFETLVRIHRAGEGAPYTGLKPVGEIEPIVALADKSIEGGAVDDLAKRISTHVSEGIHERFNHLMEKKKHASESVETGREYVEAYVVFVHFVEKIHSTISAETGHHGESESGEKKEHKH
ncbi:MAG: DUF6448 family protein [bacterium]